MNSTLQVRLLSAVSACLRPFARVMLRSGIGYAQFSELAKIAFVQEALGDHDSRGRTTNLSRVSVRTGISRKEVSRVRAVLSAEQLRGAASAAAFHSGHHAARVLQLWHTDARFLDASSSPKQLPFSGSEPSFSGLVKAAGGDVPPGAVRAELAAANAVTEDSAGLLKPTKRYFVPANVGEDLLVGLTHIVLPVLEGLARNADESCVEPFIQRLSYSDRLTQDAAHRFRDVAQLQATNCLQSVDDWISANEDEAASCAAGTLRVGLGVFYYEGVPPPGDVPEGNER